MRTYLIIFYSEHDKIIYRLRHLNNGLSSMQSRVDNLHINLTTLLEKKIIKYF